MTVSELIEELQRMPEDLEVRFAYEYGDYWNTEVCCDPVGEVQILETEYSDYHKKPKLSESHEAELTEMVILHNL
jgi:hypothetical protein